MDGNKKITCEIIAEMLLVGMASMLHLVFGVVHLFTLICAVVGSPSLCL